MPITKLYCGVRPCVHFFLLIVCGVFLNFNVYAQGFWLPIAELAPNYNHGVPLLLSDGSVMALSSSNRSDTLGDLWSKLTPNSNGDYVNGTWDTITRMKYTRLYCSSQVLMDGRVYVAGGEYGTGGGNGEVYNPITNKWTSAGPLPRGDSIWDGNSEILPGGNVLQAIVSNGSVANFIFNPTTNDYSAGPTSLGGHDESAWVKLPDNSILYVNIGSRTSERFMPALNEWIADATLPVSLYDTFDYESGAALLLPDGRAFFIGSPGTTAYYTPSGSTSPGSWAAGPRIPDSLGAPDAAAAMMPNGKILCAFSHVPDSSGDYPSPMQFYEFNYITNSFTHIPSPVGGDTLKGPSYITNMLDLPDGNILLSLLGSNRYYVYVPDGVPLTEGKPIIDSIIGVSCDTYKITGELFNGISEGSAYGDDWQMATNYPLVRLVTPNKLYGNLVYYARSFNWNRTGVMTGNLRDTAIFTLPAGLPNDVYSVQVIANGISSDLYSFAPCIETGIAQVKSGISHRISVYPSPATDQATVVFNAQISGSYQLKVLDVMGRVIIDEYGQTGIGENSRVLTLDGIARGVYNIVVTEGEEVRYAKLVVE